MIHNDTIHLIWRTLHHLRISCLMKIARATSVVLESETWKLHKSSSSPQTDFYLLARVATPKFMFHYNHDYYETRQPRRTWRRAHPSAPSWPWGRCWHTERYPRAMVSDPWTDHAGPPPWAPRRSRSPSSTHPRSWRSPKGIAPSAPPRPLHFNYLTAKMRDAFHGIRQKYPALVVCGP